MSKFVHPRSDVQAQHMLTYVRFRFTLAEPLSQALTVYNSFDMPQWHLQWCDSPASGACSAWHCRL